MNDRPDRRSHRLKNFDYTEPRSYFVTLCQDERKPVFGDVEGNLTVLSPLGVIIERELLLVERRRAPWVFIGEYIVMPNHVHVVFSNRRGSIDVHRRGEARLARNSGEAADPSSDAGDASVAPTIKPLSLGAIVGGFKSGVTREARRLGFWGDQNLWQRDYYDHVIRSETAKRKINAYIRDNPRKWNKDPLNPRCPDEEDDFGCWLKSEGEKPV